jgi:hypothetical protein
VDTDAASRLLHYRYQDQHEALDTYDEEAENHRVPATIEDLMLMHHHIAEYQEQLRQQKEQFKDYEKMTKQGAYWRFISSGDYLKMLNKRHPEADDNMEAKENEDIYLGSDDDMSVATSEYVERAPDGNTQDEEEDEEEDDDMPKDEAFTYAESPDAVYVENSEASIWRKQFDYETQITRAKSKQLEVNTGTLARN